MKYLIMIGLVLLILPIATAIQIQEIPIITIVYDTGDDNNINTEIDDNIYKVYCDDIDNICDVYRTATRHTTLTGD